jgi:hypothetical protein
VLDEAAIDQVTSLHDGLASRFRPGVSVLYRLRAEAVDAHPAQEELTELLEALDADATAYAAARAEVDAWVGAWGRRGLRPLRAGLQHIRVTPQRRHRCAHPDTVIVCAQTECPQPNMVDPLGRHHVRPPENSRNSKYWLGISRGPSGWPKTCCLTSSRLDVHLAIHSLPSAGP